MESLADLTPFLQVGAGGLLTIGILMILTGRLVPGGTVERLLASRDERIAELKSVLDSERNRNLSQAEQITSLLESGRTTAHVLEEIRRVAEKGPGEGT